MVKNLTGNAASVAAVASFRSSNSGKLFGTVLLNPSWRDLIIGVSQRKKGKITRNDINIACDFLMDMPVAENVEDTAHLYAVFPNSLVPQGLDIMKKWGFDYKSNVIMHRTEGIKDHGYLDNEEIFENVTQIVLFGVRGKNARTLEPGRTQVNYLGVPYNLYKIIEDCSMGPYLEIFNSHSRAGWSAWDWK